MTTEQAHKLAREKGISKPLYALVRLFVVPFCRLYFRMHITGTENIPKDSAAIIVPNHKSFFDSFMIGVATSRRLHHMAKKELFTSRARSWTLVRLGAFPVRRGEADGEALATAYKVLNDGGVLALFPEGTRVRNPDELGSPRRGAARIALETGTPLIPAAITGTQKLFFGPFLRPVRVQVAFGEPIAVSQLEATPAVANDVISNLVWPEVERQFHSLLNRKSLIAAALGALGIGGGLVAAKQKKKQKTPGWRFWRK